ncbi:trehalase-like domain-containing protein [Lentzea sp. NPDC054927]
MALALVAPDADGTWWCRLPPDSPALFAELPGGEGLFSIRARKDQPALGRWQVPASWRSRIRRATLRVPDDLASPLWSSHRLIVHKGLKSGKCPVAGLENVIWT